MKIIYSYILISLFTIGIAHAQAPSKFSYQAVVRDASGVLIENSPVGIQITITESSVTGTAVYIERHTVSSNKNGLISIEIGSGALQSGNFSTIDWGNNNYFLKSEMDPSGGTTYTVELSNQLLSVPYALYANSSGPQTENDPEFNASPASSITTSDITDWGDDLVDDADSDPANEIQDLSLSGNNLTITNNASATTIDLSSYLDNTDTSVLTETQVDAYVANNGYLTSETDGDPANEIQDLSLSGNNLTITNNASATTIDLSSYLDNTDTSVLTETQVDAYVANNGYLTSETDGDPANEIQDLSLSGNNLTITNNASATTIDLSSYLDNTDTSVLTETQVDAYVANNGYLTSETDGDPANEIQDLSLSGNNLTITNNASATTIDLSSYLDNTDTSVLTETQVDAYVANNGYLTSETDGDTTNEIQDLSLSGNNLTITNNASATTIDLSSYLDNTDTSVLTETQVDAYVANNGYLTSETDGDTTNEIQTLTQVGDSLFLSNSGGAVSISDSDTSVWESHTDGDIYTLNQVSLGRQTNFNVRMLLEDTLNNTKRWGSYTRVYSGDTTATNVLSGQLAVIYDKAAGVKRGLDGEAYGAGPINHGVYGRASGATSENIGVFGYGGGSAGLTLGMDAEGSGIGNWNLGARGRATGTGNNNIGVEGQATGLGNGSTGGSNIGLKGYATSHPDGNYSVYAVNPGTGINNFAGYFDGNVTVTGNLDVTGSIAKGSGTFKIDHPLDPENKYLVHSFVESPKMINIYNGKITTDSAGFAVVKLPEYVQAANKDFLYQLTVVGTFAQAIIKEEIGDNQFLIQTNEPKVKVCWEVTGVRADKYAEENRVVPELEKEKKGTYLHPELYGEAKERSENFENIQIPTPVTQDENINKSGAEGINH